MKRSKIKVIIMLVLALIAIFAINSVSYAACSACSANSHYLCTLSSVNYHQATASYHYVYCCDDKVVIYQENHTFGSWSTTTAAKCTTTGTRKKTCSRCSYASTETIPALGHDMNTWSVNVAATCTANGQNKRTCKRSGCTYSETSVIPALGHDWDQNWTWDASNPTGKHWHKCNRSGCTAKDSEGQHVDSNKDGYCDTCRYQMYILVTIPVKATDSFVYNGQTQTPTYNDYDTSKTSISGHQQLHVGNYTAVISLKTNDPPYRWKERYQGTQTGSATASISYTWKITKKRVTAQWGTSRVFECDKTRTQIPSVVIPTGLSNDTITPNVYEAKTFVGDYTAYCKIGSVTGAGAVGDYQLDPDPSSVAFKIVDTTRPTITVTPSHTTWTKTDVTFTLVAADSGQGVNRIEYSLDGLTWKTDVNYTSGKTNATKTFSSTQDNLIYFRSIDECDNISETAGPYVIKIDKVNPTFTYTKDPEKDWTCQDLILSILANDNMGVASVKVNNETIPAADIKNQGVENDRVTTLLATKRIPQNGTYQVVVTDVAGNTASQNIAITNIDKIKPQIVFPSAINENAQTIRFTDTTAPNSKMRYIAVCTSNTEPLVFGDGSSTEGDLLDYYYQVTNDAEVNFNFTFKQEGTYYIFARDMAGNVQSQAVTLTYVDVSKATEVDIQMVYDGGVATGYIYDGLPHTPTITLKDKVKSNRVMVEDVDYTKTVTNNIDHGVASVVFKGIGNYKGTITKNFNIERRDLNIVPDSNQSKLTLVDDPIFTYTYNNNVPGEVPKFDGILLRDTGEDVGLYNIVIGTLRHIDNLETNLKADNYQIVLTQGIKFEISDFNALITKWKVTASDKSITLPIPGYATNDYLISWGDGKYDQITQAGFPSHTYALAGEYLVRVTGNINTFGYVGDIKPTTSNIYSSYVSSNEKIIGLLAFGDIKAQRIGFSYCTNLAGTIPASSGFSALTSFENMFNECVNLVGPIPANFFKNVTTSDSARKTFNNCKKLTGSLSATTFEGCSGIKSFEETYNGCIAMTGSIPENMFVSNINADTFAGVFANMTGISGAVPEKLFETNTKVLSFSEAFSSDRGLTSIPEKLFDTNTIATNYYHTFYACTGLTSVPTKLFKNNIVNTISNEPDCFKDYRGTFENCTGLTTLDLDCLVIGKEMFKGCTSINKIVLPSVSELGDEAFYRCTALTHIKIAKDNLATIGNDAFEYTGANAPLLTYVNKENEILYNYVWPEDNRRLDYIAPTGTVEIVSGTYPFTKTEQIRLKITVTDDISTPNQCMIAILNDADLKDFTPEQIAAYRIVDSEAESGQTESVFTIFDWKPYVENKDWTLTNGEGLKTVYVYFKDEMGNISFVSQDLELAP